MVWHGTIAFGVLLATVASAAAQPLPWRTEEPRSAGWTFTPGASFGAAWDSGVQTGSNPVIEALFQKYVGRVSPYAELDFSGRRTTMNAGYSGSMDKYWGSSAGYEQHMRFSTSRIVTRRFSTSADAGYSLAPTTDRLLLADAAQPVVDATLPFADVDASYFTAGGGFSYVASPRVTVAGSYRFRQVDLDRDESLGELETLRDGRAHAPAVSVMRAFTPRLSVGGAFEYRREVVGADNDFDVQTGAGAFSYAVTPLTSISGGGGLSRLEILGTGISTVAPTYYGGVTHEREGLRMNGAYSRGFNPLYGFGTMASSHTFSFGASTPFMDRIYYLSALVAYSRSRAVQDIGLGFDLDTVWTNASVGRRLTEWLVAEAYLNVSTQDSTVRGDSNRTRLGVQFVASTLMRMQ